MSLEELQKKRGVLKKNSDKIFRNMEKLSDESIRVAEVAHTSRELLDGLDNEFEKQSGLDRKDTKFLFAAIGLQLLRITIINELTKIEPAGSKNSLEEKLHDFQEKVLSKFDANGSVINKPYYASTNQIISTKGVPYDAMESLTAKSLEKKMNRKGPINWDFDLDEYINEEKLHLFKGANHRFSTLGHDPLIGLVIGTANIMTNTITCVNSPLSIGEFQVPIITTNHVIYTTDYKHPLIGVYGSSAVMLGKMFDRIINEPNAFVAAMIKQIIHIGTDMFTTAGIQFPSANLIMSNTNVEKITKQIGWGDLVKVGTSAKIAELINTVISTLHTLIHDFTDGISNEIYNVRTRKIILYSNAIATGSNVIWSGVNIMAGDKAQIKNLDIGGLLVILKRLRSDTEYIRKIKEEFVFDGFNKMIQGEPLELEEVIWE